MADLSPDRILKALEPVKDPDLGTSIVAMGMIKDIAIDGTKVSFTCELTTPACPVKDKIEQDIRNAINTAFPEVTQLNVQMTGKVRGAQALVDSTNSENLIPQIKNVVLVVSGKGGTGKSTIAVNIAAALQARGATVGLLDADIYTPALGIMTGLREKPKLSGENKIKPLNAFGLEVMSMGFLVEMGQPMMWRGPVLNGIIAQFLRDVLWSPADYLIVDIPPGPADVLLAITQNARVTGAMVVTTPQFVALAAALRTRSMLEQLRIPLLGVVENFADAPAGPALFGTGAAEQAAKESSVPFLGSIPTDPALVRTADLGVPLVCSEPQTPAARALIGVAERLAARVSIHNLARNSGKAEEHSANTPQPTAVV